MRVLLAFAIPLVLVALGVHYIRRDEAAGVLAFLGAILLWIVDIVAVIWG